MLHKMHELPFIKLFGLIAAYFLCSLLFYRVVRYMGHGDDMLFGLGIVSVVITGVLFWLLMVMRKRSKARKRQ